MTLSEKIRKFFDDNEINFDFQPKEKDDELDSYEAGFKGNNGSFKIRLLVNEEAEWLLVLGFPQFVVPKKYMDRAILSANHFNSSRLFVILTIDPEDGEVCFRMGVHTEESTTPEHVGRAVWTVCNAIDHDTPELMESIFRNNETLN